MTLPNHRAVSLLILLGIASRLGQAKSGDGADTPGPTENAITEQRSGYEWLVGRWRCVTRQLLTPQEYLIAADGDNVLEFFNVYLPFADDHLTDDSDTAAQEIAAEFLVRRVTPSGDVLDQWKPMFEQGPIRITKSQISYGIPASRDLVFNYSITVRGGRSWLKLESRAMKFELLKASEDPGDLQKSFVVAPVRNYTAARIARLRMQYHDQQKRSQNQPH